MAERNPWFYGPVPTDAAGPVNPAMGGPMPAIPGMDAASSWLGMNVQNSPQIETYISQAHKANPNNLWNKLQGWFAPKMQFEPGVPPELPNWGVPEPQAAAEAGPAGIATSGYTPKLIGPPPDMAPDTWSGPLLEQLRRQTDAIKGAMQPENVLTRLSQVLGSAAGAADGGWGPAGAAFAAAVAADRDRELQRQLAAIQLDTPLYKLEADAAREAASRADTNATRRWQAEGANVNTENEAGQWNASERNANARASAQIAASKPDPESRRLELLFQAMGGGGAAGRAARESLYSDAPGVLAGFTADDARGIVDASLQVNPKTGKLDAAAERAFQKTYNIPAPPPGYKTGQSRLQYYYGQAMSNKALQAMAATGQATPGLAGRSRLGASTIGY